MKKLIVIVFIIGFAAGSFAEDYLDMNFFIEPKYNFDKTNLINFHVKNIRNDSIRQVNIFAGRILEKPRSDSMTVSFLNAIQPHLSSPVDYLYYEKDVEFKLLISNIESDSIPIIKNEIIKTDSMKIGIFSIYTPDFVVKNNIAAHSEFDFNVFEIAKEQAEYLAKRTDYVIMLSSLSKYIDNDVVKNIPVDAVISFDYQKKTNSVLSNHLTKFYSILTNQGRYGKLRLIYKNGKIKKKWQEIEFDVGSH
ncbi:MAG: hypothetical protein K8R49_00750 [Candidatus Cloacimonetes bacterium]|nr:hypothetical protein [Candidatus Cloacimonadota bacterium]